MNEHAQALGRLAAGIKKRLSAERREGLRLALSGVRYRGGRKPGAKNRPKVKPAANGTGTGGNGTNGKAAAE